MRPVLRGLLAAAACLLAPASGAGADVIAPKSATDFRDSVGVNTHAVYFDTAYADWDRVMAKLEELGVRHLRDGVYGNPAPQWRDWNERYYAAVELAAERGMRFDFLVGRPGNDAGTLDELIRVVAGRLRHAADALEAPNEFDKFVGGPRWPAALSSYTRDLFRRANAHPSLRALPVLGPSLATSDGPQLVGDQRPWLDLGNIHPYTGGLSPDPGHLGSELARASIVFGAKPVWATEAGFHNALRETSREQQPPVSEDAAAVYLLRTLLEHFRSGIERTYVYELLDEKPEPGRRDPEQHFGLLRHDFSPKPAYTALRNLLALVGRDDDRSRMRPLRLTVSGAGDDVRRLVLQKADGTYLVALWRLASVWDTERQRPIRVAPRTLAIDLPGGARVASADPVRSARTRPLRVRGGRARVALAGRPVVLHVAP